MTEGLRVAIVGGSMGGLTAGLLLHDLGHEVHVYERSMAALEERGAGIVVLPMTERYLIDRSGSDDRVSLELPWWKYVDQEGNELSADLDRFRFSSWNAVYRALLDMFPAENYHLGYEAASFEQTGQEVVVTFTNGTQTTVDLVVCADGVSSTARSFFLPGVEPVYSGYVAWRGVAPEVNLGPDAIEQLADSLLYQVLDRSHILAYAIPGVDGSTEPGGRLQNFVWYRNYAPGAPRDSVMTDRHGDRRTASVPPGLVQQVHLDELESASEALAPVLRQIVRASREPFIQAIFDLEVDQMVFGRVCIMGDAAFSARPHVAAGTAKAAADGWALRDALRDNDDVDVALAKWEEGQLALGRSIVQRSRDMGRRSQVLNTMIPGDADWKFGL